MIYNVPIFRMWEIVMRGRTQVFRNIGIYFLLFLCSFMVFDSTTLVIAVFVALVALYHFSHKITRRKQL